MAFAFGHLIGAWLVGIIIEKLSKIKITNFGWGLLLFGGVLPDIDFLFNLVFGFGHHRSITHSLLFVIIAYFTVYLVLRKFKLEKEAVFIPIGILVHLSLDMIGYPGIMLFWPLDYFVHFFSINKGIALLGIAEENLMLKIRYLIIDMVLGVIWIGWLYYSKKLNFRR